MRGDTIVEVILATALITSAIGLAIGLSNHNLQTGIASGQRSQALAIAQGQVEHIKSAYLAASPLLDSYKIAQPFCILGDGSVERADSQNSKCSSFNGGSFSLTNKFDATSLIFTIGAAWPSNTNVTTNDQLTLYYKLPPAVTNNANNTPPPLPADDSVVINDKYTIGPGYNFPTLTVYAKTSANTPVNNGNPILQKTYSTFCDNGASPGGTCDITVNEVIHLANFGTTNALTPNGQIHMSFGSANNPYHYPGPTVRLYINSVTVAGQSVDPAKAYTAGSVSQPLTTTGSGDAYWISAN